MEDFEIYSEALELFKLLHPKVKRIGSDRVQFVDYLGRATNYAGHSDSGDGRGAYEKVFSSELIFARENGRETIVIGRSYTGSGSGCGEDCYYVEDGLLEKLRKRVEEITRP